LASYDPDGGESRAMVESDHDCLFEWADAKVERVRETATPITAAAFASTD
jgi:hypothetical protein